MVKYIGEHRPKTVKIVLEFDNPAEYKLFENGLNNALDGALEGEERRVVDAVYFAIPNPEDVED